MSLDTAFAAQFWLWPDPAMKRDAQGRILFVNAAFLQLYGGTVEAWTGNVVQGWPNPHPLQPGMTPMPHRFETRIPSQHPDIGEQVYDWIEQTELDGSAFALARNVSAYAVTAPPPPGQTMETPMNSAQQMTEAVAPLQETLQEMTPSYDQMPEEAPEPVMESAQAQTLTEPAFESAIEPAPATEVSVETPLPSEPETVIEAEAPTAQPAAEEVSIDAFDTPPAEIETQREERDFERRALPIESNSAVLGNNWRDAVIAKAVGVETPAPEEETPKVVATPSETERDTNGPKRILLAEDNAINALLTRTLLEAEGHTVETVEDGALAVEAMKTQSYDLIFMDMRMPNMDGLEATRKIRQLPNVPRDLPIVALTANAFDDDRNACFDSGMNDFMTKPVSAEELSAMVKNWTGEKELDIAS